VAPLINKEHDQVSSRIGLSHRSEEILAGNITTSDAPKPGTSVENLFNFQRVYLVLVGQLTDNVT
jgi:hypothetical protein